MKPALPLYIYIDEGGDLTFSNSGSAYFTLTAYVSLGLPPMVSELTALRAALPAEGIVIDRFHATSDLQRVRNKVFDIIQRNLGPGSVETIVVEKRKTVPPWQELVIFYSKMMGWLLRYRLKDLNPLVVSKVIVITDRLPAHKLKARALEKAIKSELIPVQYFGKITHEVFHEPSANHVGLQVADYCNWAIYRKWSMGDLRSYEIVKPKLRAEFEIFQRGTTKFY